MSATRHVMTPAELGWVAGIIEGEGSIIRPRTPHSTKGYMSKSTQIHVGSTDMDIPERLYRLTGCGAIRHRVPQRVGWQTQHHWTVSYWPDVERILRDIAPMVGERRRSRIIEVLSDPPGHVRRRRPQPLVSPFQCSCWQGFHDRRYKADMDILRQLSEIKMVQS